MICLLYGYVAMFVVWIRGDMFVVWMRDDMFVVWITWRYVCCMDTW